MYKDLAQNYDFSVFENRSKAILISPRKIKILG